MHISVSNKCGYSIKKSDKPIVCITMGYPAGIGPEIIVKALAGPEIKRLANFFIVGDESIFEKAKRISHTQLNCKITRKVENIDFSDTNIVLFSLDNVAEKNFRFGITKASYGRASIDYITEAVLLIRSKNADCLVTGPIHKYAAELSGFKYPGHTEYLAHLAGAEKIAMMFSGGPLKIVLATTHLPLKEVARNLSEKKILDILILTNKSLKRYFAIKRPLIAVCGLNPHAGENGTFGDEEIKVIIPAVKKAKGKGIDVYGPIAADALFVDLYKGRYDAAACMYHDQGLVALKMIARDNSVNITLGLPFIRTSPAHGSALDIAGKDRASCESMKEAIRVAVAMLRHQ